MPKWLLTVVVLSLVLSACAPAPAPAAAPTPTAAPAAQSDTQSPTAAPAAQSDTQSPTASPTEAAPTPAESLVFTRAITSEPAGLDPQGAAGAGQNAILPFLYDTLVYRDVDNTYHPYLAEKWDISEDGKLVTFILRPNIKFHDGTPLDAEAVKFTFDRLIAQGQKSVLASLVTVIDQVEAVDATTVRFHFKEPSSTFLSSISNSYAGIISPSAVKASGDNFSTQPVGSGPFKFEKWEPGVAVTLVKNPDYAWAPPVVKNQGAPAIDTLVFKVLPDASQQVSALQAGEVDALFVNQPNHLARLQKDPSVEVIETTLNSLIYLGFNVKKAPFDDPRVRQAVSHMVDKETLLKTALGGIGEVAFAPLAPTLPGFDPALKSAELGFDLEKARALLAEAGITQSADGALTRDGQPLRATLVTSTRPPNQAIATVLQSQMKAAGLEVEIQMLDANAVQETLGKGAFDMMLWRYDWNDADVLRTYLSSARIGRTNRNNYSNEKVDALLEQAAHELDEAKRNAFYLEAQKLLLEDAPWQPLYTPKDYMVIRKEITGVVMGPMGRMMLNDVQRVQP